MKTTFEIAQTIGCMEKFLRKEYTLLLLAMMHDEPITNYRQGGCKGFVTPDMTGDISDFVSPQRFLAGCEYGGPLIYHLPSTVTIADWYDTTKEEGLRILKEQAPEIIGHLKQLGWGILIRV